MYKNKHAESFVWIMIGVFLLSIVILGMSNLLNYSGGIIQDYEDNTKITILRNNTNNIVSQIDTSSIAENEIFYIKNNQVTNTYIALTWSLNEPNRYINEFNQNIDPNTEEGPIYSRQLLLEREDVSTWEQNQVIRVSIRRLIKKDWI